MLTLRPALIAFGFLVLLLAVLILGGMAFLLGLLAWLAVLA